MFIESGANNGFREDLKSKKSIKHLKMSNPPFKYLNTPELWLTPLLQNLETLNWQSQLALPCVLVHNSVTVGSVLSQWNV